MSKTKYTYDQLSAAFAEWQSAKQENRQAAWLIYLDVRDGEPLGTNEAKSIRRFQRNGKPFRENKLDAAEWK